MSEKIFIDLVLDVLKENDDNLQRLFDGVISKSTFYKYRQRWPNLQTVLKIANHLKVSLDYLFKFSNENRFSVYSYSANVFCKNLLQYLENKNLSGRQFCEELNFSRDNILRWKKGILPTIPTLLQISEFFDCTLDDLIKK